MRSVLLSRQTSVYGRSIYLAAREAGVPFDAVLLEKPAEWALSKRIVHHLRSGSFLRASSGFARRGLRAVLVRLGMAQRQDPTTGENRLVGGEETLNLKELCRRDGVPCPEVENHNSPESVETLKELAPSVIVLGGTRILRAPILSVPEVGALNAHAGILPAYRGMNVIEWAIRQGDPVGITVHFVDTGVDTGDIVRIVEVPLEPGDTIQIVRDRAHLIQAESLAAVMKQIERGEPLERRPQSKGEGKQYYRMTDEERAETEAILAEMRPEVIGRR
ncbi:MAG: formyl transferase [Planctomycetota bacterium]